MSKKSLINITKVFLILLLSVALLTVSMSAFTRKGKKPDESTNSDSSFSKTPLSGKYISFLGDSITTYEGWSNSTSYNSNIGSNSVYYNTSTGLSVNDTWWKQVIDENGMRLCVNNSWSASRLTARMDTPDIIPNIIARSQYLHNDKKDISPDVVVIYLGTNDIGNGIVSRSTFEDAYYARLDNMTNFEDPLHMLLEAYYCIRQYYNCDIFICTLLPESRNVEYQEELQFFNDQVRIFEDCLSNVYIVDLYKDSGITYDNYELYTIDDGNIRVHPNTAGMDLITKCVQNKFKEVYDF